MRKKYYKNKGRRRKTWSPITPGAGEKILDIEPKYELMSLEELLYNENLLRKESKELKTIIYDETNSTHIDYKNKRDSWWNLRGRLQENLKVICEEEIAVKGRKKLGTNVLEILRIKDAGRNKQKYLNAYTHFILEEIESPGSVLTDPSGIDYHREELGLPAIGKNPIRASDYLSGEEIRKYHIVYESYQEINSIYDNLKERLDVVNYLLFRMANLKRKASAKKKAARLAAFDGESREIGSQIAIQIKRDAEERFHCPYCESRTEKKDAHVDHINPIFNGGQSVENNMILVCADCNLKKSSYSLFNFCKKFNLDYLTVSERLASQGKWV